MEPILRGLNAAQKAAVTSPASALQVLAPPGSGKTKTLTSRVAYLLSHHGFAPCNVICCTFTIKASKEMRERLRDMVGREVESKLILGTFHSICRRYLVTYGHLIGIPKNFGIADSADSLAIIRRVIKRLNFGIDPKAARARISHRKARGQKLDAQVKSAKKSVENQEFSTVSQEYQRALETSNLLDYDDLLIRCSDLLRAHPQCVSNVEALLIDEFQDTNVVQFELMKLLAAAKCRITIVGDPDQSIYGFRSAEIENLQRMTAFYRESVVINLEENYRSSTAILTLAQEVIEQDTERPMKRLKSTHNYGSLPVLRKLPNSHEEARWIVSEIKRMKVLSGGLIRYSDIAILLRSAFLSLLIEKALGSAGIPYRMVGGHRFFDRVEIRILLDYLRAISQPNNNSALISIINVPSRKIGESTVKELLRVSELQGRSVWSTVQKLLTGAAVLDKKLSGPAEQNLRKFRDLIVDARNQMPFFVAESTPKELLDLVISKIDFKQYLRSKYEEDFEDRWENVEELLSQAGDIADPQKAPDDIPVEEDLPEIEGLEQRKLLGGEEALSRFLANIVLSTEVEFSEDGVQQERVVMSTIHSAKGLEWPVVFIPAVYEGSIPHSRSEDTDEERRLIYVAMTRAQALLNMSFPLQQSRDQAESILSRFLPPDVHRRCANIAPEFSEKVIKDIATITRRDVPSQQDLVDCLQTVADGDSVSDDLWPADGSHRPKYSAMGDDKAGMFSLDGSRLCSFKVQEARRGSFTISAATLGFTTASQQLQAATEIARVATSPSVQSMMETVSKQQRQSTAGRNRGSWAAFFKQSSFQEPASKRNFHAILGPAAVELEELSLPRACQVPTPDEIPREYAGHRLPAATRSVKRPRPALEEIASPNRKRYAFLSSSPKREEEGTDARGPRGGNAISAPAAGSQGVAGGVRPAITMHTTTLATFQTGGPVRRTLGLRRTMSGWEARRHR